MTYIACPACDEGIDISNISFTVESVAQLWDVVETNDKDIWCPHCKEKYTISTEIDFSSILNITSEDCTYRDSLEIEWEEGGFPLSNIMMRRRIEK